MNQLSPLRKACKHYFPKPIRIGLRAILTYVQRIGRWVVILFQMRGETLKDQLILITSALASPFISLYGLTRWQDPQLLFDIEVVVFGIGHFYLRRYTDDLYHVLPWREKDVLNVLRSHLEPGDTFVDAGANIGFYTIAASRLVGKSGKVISVEMMPDTAQILRRHCKINHVNNGQIVEKALSETSNKIVVARVPIGKYGQASISEPSMTGEINEMNVQTTTLDELLAKTPAIKLIKMDLEGAELLAIKGAKETLGKSNHIIFESWGDEKGNLVTSYLSEKGLSISTIDDRNKLAQNKLRLKTL